MLLTQCTMSSAIPVLTLLLHRHGMRNPFVYFEGIGDHVPSGQLALLTDRGHRQMTELGKHLARKHGLATKNATDGRAAFLSSQVISADVLSSSVQRCIDSAQIIFKNFIGKDVDPTLLKVDYGNLYHEMIAGNIEPMVSARFETPHSETVADYLNYLNEKANSKFTDMKDKYQIVESLLTANKNGHEIPPYTDHDTLENCLNVLLFNFVKGHEKILAVEVLEDLQNRLRELPSAVNYVGYSVSDIHVVSVLELLEMPLQRWPDYGYAYELNFYGDGTVVLDEIRNSPDAIIKESLAINKTTVAKVKECLTRTLQ